MLLGNKYIVIWQEGGMSNKPTGWSISGSLIFLKWHVLSSLLTSVHASQKGKLLIWEEVFFNQHRVYVFALKQDGGKINKSFLIFLLFIILVFMKAYLDAEEDRIAYVVCLVNILLKRGVGSWELV